MLVLKDFDPEKQQLKVNKQWEQMDLERAVKKLVGAFFEMYSRYDFRTKAISITETNVIRKYTTWVGKVLYIEVHDPFTGYTLNRATNSRNYYRFMVRKLKEANRDFGKHQTLKSLNLDEDGERLIGYPYTPAEICNWEWSLNLAEDEVLKKHEPPSPGSKKDRKIGQSDEGKSRDGRKDDGDKDRSGRSSRTSHQH